MTAKMAILGSTWRLLGRFGEHFGAIWANGQSIEKHLKKQLVFASFLRIGRSRRAVLEQLGAMLGHLDAILEQLGLKMEAKSDKMSQKIETMHFTMCF